MKRSYKAKLEKASKILYEIFEDEVDNFIDSGAKLDELIFEIGRQASKCMLEKVYNEIAARLSDKYKSQGLQIERNPEISFKTVLVSSQCLTLG